ncbi:hypothetical protein V1477_011435, partial [Vespula maculifrons]
YKKRVKSKQKQALLDTSSDLHLTRAEEYKRLRFSPMNSLEIACNRNRIQPIYTEFIQNTSRFIRKNVFPLHSYRLANSHPVDVD